MRILLTALFCLCLPLAGAEKKTDVEKAGYKGRVKSVKVTAFKIEEKDGKQVRTQVRTPTPSTKYDEKSNQTEEVRCDASGKIKGKTTYKYDEKGNRVEEVEQDSDGKILFKYIYKYDEKGNPISRTTSGPKTPSRKTRYGFVMPDEKNWEFTYWD